MRTSERDRLLRLIHAAGILILLGLAYAWIAGHAGGIPCVFYLATGWKCPGCGVTRMCLHMLHGDLYGAFRQNMAVFCLLPMGVTLACSRCASYVRTGRIHLSAWENGLIWSMVVILLLFGAVRNFAGL